MRIRTLWIIGLALSLVACAQKDQPAPAQGQDTNKAAEAPELSAAQKAVVGTEAFLRHMHMHARQLETLNAALDAGDLEAAQTPAYWLSKHEGVSWPVDDWQPYIKEMRDAANEVTDAPDIETARAGARHIADGCRGCHREAGVDIVMPTSG